MGKQDKRSRKQYSDDHSSSSESYHRSRKHKRNKHSHHRSKKHHRSHSSDKDRHRVKREHQQSPHRSHAEHKEKKQHRDRDHHSDQHRDHREYREGHRVKIEHRERYERDSRERRDEGEDRRRYEHGAEVKHEGWEDSESNIKRQRLAAFQNKNNENEGENIAQAPKKQVPTWQPSGILLQFYNARQGIALKFHQPPQSHSPLTQWRVYPFKDNNPMHPIILKQSCYLIGKDERVCDILCENSSISRQHAVIQFRAQHIQQIDGTYSVVVKPYLMDLDSTNGTMLNGDKIQSGRYYQLLDKDSIKFGLSDREYLMFKVPETQQLE